MPHPFFDVGTFPWSRPEAIAFHDALSRAITVPARINVIYQQAGGVTLLNIGQAPDLVWKEAIDHCATHGLLRQLCQRLRTQGEWTTLEPVVIAVESATDLLDVKVLANERIFVDRKNLRGEILKLCGTAASHGVMLVRGDPNSGKSWTKYFIEELARGLGAECVYLFEGFVASVDGVLTELFAALGNSAAKPTPLETEPAFFSRACAKLQEVARDGNRQLWVVVDDLGLGDDNEPRLDRQIREFFDQFVLSMANPAFAKWFRLVLLDYPNGDVPTKWRDVWVEDNPVENEADSAALSEFLAQWAARKRKQILEADAKKFVDGVIAKVDAVPAPGAVAPPRMIRLHNELKAALKTL